MPNKTLVFTGGGSAGHVTPNLALISRLSEEGWNIHYIGSADGIEKGIVTEQGIPFHPISSGKLRRYFDLKNFKDPFKVLKGVGDAYRVLRKLKPKAIFSKGGFVAVPVVLAARLARIPVIIHESDMTPGLANRISSRFADKICATFPETMKSLPAGKSVLTGLPIRKELDTGSAEKGRKACGFSSTKPVLLVMGGSLGSKTINDAVRGQLKELLNKFQILHLCGKGHLDKSAEGIPGYKQLEYASSDLPDLLAMADMVISRAGSTSLFEFLHLKLPMLLIPLSQQVSRGDQILNAKSFTEQGFAETLQEEELTEESFRSNLNKVWDNRYRYKAAMETFSGQQAVETIAELIHQAAKA
ncbi:undecaprenyldiphospho-muramoylpentapeptide beta-N-acetylglucosaminyltransferase [Gorillibacterium massiliense]|uniref:undecaprenyldiphospho-muramoylpentapeptide beta-N-acetylglucosaminyltransferase n=1 Tax=Gorillibacterium massiliense TaxID=1280390 RepID=UPI0004AD4C9A|nr:undecaprenyldiphospho-muramoylpentapeptide beta-N-acetylglucosaminyltransferase [Gorillibacterium massiliense]